jgi:hypothetical protein
MTRGGGITTEMQRVRSNNDLKLDFPNAENSP